jgi:hypothetical protein
MKAEKKKVMERKGAKAENYLLQSFHNYIDSFRRIRIDILLMALYDAIFFFLIFSIAKSLLTRIFSSAVSLMSMATPSLEDSAALSAGAQAIKAFFFSSGIDLAMTIILSIFLYCIFKSLIWLIVARRRLAWNYLSGFCAMSFIWFIGWIAICVISYFLLTEGTQKAVYAIVLLLLLYLTPIMNSAFAKNAKIFHSLKSVFTLGIGNIHLFILPCIVSVLTAIIPLFLLSRLLAVISMPPTISVIILTAIILLFLSWHRIYLNIIVGEIK